MAESAEKRGSSGASEGRPAAPPRRGGLLRRTLLLLLVMLALVLGAILLFPDRLLVPWVLPAAQSAAREHGWQLTIEELEGALGRRLHLRGVRLLALDAALPEVELAVERVEVDWSPWSVLTGTGAPVTALRLTGGTLRVDLTRGAFAAASAEPAALPALADFAALLDELPAFSVDRLQVELRAPSHGWLRTPVLTAWATLSADGARLTLEEGGLDGDGPEGRLPTGAVLTAPALLDLTRLSDSELPFTTDIGVLGGELRMQGVLNEAALDVDFTARDVQLAALWRAAREDAAASPIAGPLQLAGTWHLPLDGSGPGTAEARFTLAATQVSGLQLDAATGTLSLADGVLRASDVQITQAANVFTVQALALPLDLPVRSLIAALDLRVTVDCRDIPALLAALRAAALLPALPDATSAELAAALEGEVSRQPHQLTLQMSLQNGALSFREGLLQTAGGTLALEQGAFDLTAPEPLDAALELRLTAAFADLSPLGQLLSPLLTPPDDGAAEAPAAWAGSLTSRAHVTGSLRAPLAELEVDGQGLVVAGWDLGGVRARADIDTRELRLREFSVEAAGASFAARGTCELASRMLRDVTLDAELRDPAWLPVSDLRGTLVAHAVLSGPLLAPFGSVSFSGRDLAWADVVLEQLDVHATHAPGLLTVDRLTLRTPWGDVSASGAAALDETRALHDEVAALQAVRLDSLVLHREGLDFALVAPTELQRDAGRWRGGPLELAGGAGSLRVTLGSAAAASVAPADGAEAGGATAGAGAATVQTLRVEAQGLQPLLALPDGASVQELDADLTARFGSGELSAHGTLAARGLRLQTGRVALRAEATAWLTLGGSLAAPRGELELAARELVVDLPGRVAEQGFGPCTLDAHLTLAESLVLDWLHIDSPHQVNLDGRGALGIPADLGARFAAALEATAAGPGASSTALAAAALDEALADAPLSFEVAASAGRLEALSALLLDVRRMDGEVVGELAVSGVWGRPDVRGRITVSGAELRLASGFPPLDALQAQLDLEGDTLLVRELRGELGSAPFTVTGTWGLRDGGPGLDLAFRGEDLLLYRADGVTVRANADITVRGPPDALTAAGTLTLRDSGVVSSLNLLHFAQGGGRSSARGLQLFSFNEPPLSTLTLDLRVTAEEPFFIRNTIVRGGLRPDLRLTGTGRTPILDGSLFVEPSKVFLPSGSVSVDGGRVIFSAADPFQPRLDLQASARRRGYDVSIQVSGVYDQPVVTLSSVPPLASDRILLLVLTGQSPGRGAIGPAGTDTTTHTVAVYFGQDLLARWLGDEQLDEDGLLDRIAVDVVKDVSTSNSDLLQVSYRLTPLPKGGGQATFLRAEKDIYDRINFGVQFLFRLE